MSIKILKVREQEIAFFNKQDEDFISLTDIAKIKNQVEPKDVIKYLFRKRSTV